MSDALTDLLTRHVARFAESLAEMTGCLPLASLDGSQP